MFLFFYAKQMWNCHGVGLLVILKICKLLIRLFNIIVKTLTTISSVSSKFKKSYQQKKHINMKTTIICPTDFSETANNATEYAAKLAQILNAELTLVNVQRIIPEAAAVSLSEGVARNTRENSLIASNKLKEMSIEINKMFKISTTYEVDITTKSLTKTISSLGKQSAMIVMGTNGADNLTQFFFGTNTYNVIKKTECPVLIVPEDLTFGTYKNILYPIIYEKVEGTALEQFYEFVKHFDAQFTFLHISKKDTENTLNAFNRLKEEVENFFEGKLKLTFKRVFAENVDDAIDDFIQENPTDLMVMEARHRNVIENLFQKKPLLATLSAIAPYPIYVVHS